MQEPLTGGSATATGANYEALLAERDVKIAEIERAIAEAAKPAEAAEALLAARQQARAEKNWAVADAIRDGITALGLVVEDTAAGARLHRKE